MAMQRHILTLDQTKLNAVAAALDVTSAPPDQLGDIRFQISRRSQTQSQYDALVLKLKPITEKDSYD